jgi:archaemetzincin
MKNSPLKSLVNIFILVATFVYVNDSLKQHDYDLHKFADSYDKEHKLGKYSKGDAVMDNPSSKMGDYDYNEPTTKEIKSKPKDIVYIHGLGKYNQEDLINIRNGVEDFYGFEVVIGKPYTNLSSYYFVDGGENLHSIRVLELSENVSGRHIYVTDYPLYNNENDRKIISGWGRFYHNSCVVSSYQMIQYGNYSSEKMVTTANHELGHNFGLRHCDNQNCLMKAIGLDSKEFCNNCKIKLNQ